MYLHFIAGNGVVYQVVTPGLCRLGADQRASALAPVQIEMKETNDVAGFKSIVATSVELIQTDFKEINIPLTFDTTSSTGVKPHSCCSQYWHETDHNDRYTYFNRMHYCKASFASAIAGGIPLQQNQ